MGNSSATLYTLDQMYDDILTTCTVADIETTENDRETVRKFLNTYPEFFTETTVSFRTTTKPKEKRDLSVRYLAFDRPHDPYRMAIDRGFLVESGHPEEKVIPALQARFPAMGYGSDFTVKQGFEKIWILFLTGPLTLKEVLSLSCLPPSIQTHAEFLDRNDLNLSALFGINYKQHAFNLYFERQGPRWLHPDKVARMLDELGFAVPSPEILEINSRAATFYYTFTWDSPRVERISFGLPAFSPSEVPVLDPLLTRLTTEAPIRFPQRQFVYNTTYTRDQDYYKMDVDYSGKMAPILKMIAEGVERKASRPH